MRRVEIGNPRGKIALLLDESDAVNLAEVFGPSDLAWKELMDAVEKAYPPETEDEDSPGLIITVSER